MKKSIFRQISYILVGMTACGMLLITGCSLRPEDDYETKETADVDTSGNDAGISASANMAEAEATDEEASTDELTIVVDNDGSHVFTDSDEEENGEYVYETVEIEDLEEPTDEDGEWTDYILDAAVLEAEWDDEENNYGENGVRLYIENYPVIYVSDSEEEAELNESLTDVFQNKFVYRYQMKDLDVELTCTVLYESRIVCYEFTGEVYHTGNDLRYEDEREYMYYVTIDRMTGAVINLETVYGVENAYEDILNGNYEVIRAEDSVFERFEDDLLADVYVNEPLFSDDIDHELDFYLDEEGYVYVVIWVGEENGSYAILKLGKSKL